MEQLKKFTRKKPKCNAVSIKLTQQESDFLINNYLSPTKVFKAKLEELGLNYDKRKNITK